MYCFLFFTLCVSKGMKLLDFGIFTYIYTNQLKKLNLKRFVYYYFIEKEMNRYY
jgi:hypothetical protein